MQAQWDLAIRLAEAGYEGVAVAALAAGGATICERAGEEAVRALYRKHAPSTRRACASCCSTASAPSASCCARTTSPSAQLEEELRPRLRARRRERDRLGAKLATRAPRTAGAAAARGCPGATCAGSSR